MGEASSSFRGLLEGWAESACRDWQYPPPDAAWYAEVLDRVPSGVGELVARGVAEGLIVEVDRHKFSLRDLPPGKGPYAFFSRSQQRRLGVNWEYLVQAAEYARLHRALARSGLRLGVEDRLMDLTVSDSAGHLLWYLEVKEKPTEIAGFVDEIERHGTAGVDLGSADRGNDALRKAKYLIRYRPLYFSVSAIGIRVDRQVEYGSDSTFRLRPDMVPIA